jgi:uncharacterized membrane protein
VREFYETVDVQKATSFLKAYGVSFVVVGNLEKRTYGQPGLKKFGLFPELFMKRAEFGEAAVYEVPVWGTSFEKTSSKLRK